MFLQVLAGVSMHGSVSVTYIHHTYIHTDLYSAKNRENESEPVKADWEMTLQVAFKGG